MSDTHPGLRYLCVRGLIATVDTTRRLVSLIGIFSKKNTTSNSEKYSSYEYFSSDQKIFQDIWYLIIWSWPIETPEDIKTHPEKYSSYEYFSSDQIMFQDFLYMNMQFWSIEILEDIKILHIKFLLVMSVFMIFWFPLFLWGYCNCTSIGMGWLCIVWFI